MGTTKKLSVEEQITRAQKQKEDAERKLAELKGAEFWERNKAGLITFWKEKIKANNKDVSDKDLLNQFIKTVEMKGILVVKKEPAPKKPSTPKKETAPKS